MSTVKRNDPCPCGSGKRYKKCCLGKETEQSLNNFSEDDMSEEEKKEELFELTNEIIKKWTKLPLLTMEQYEKIYNVESKFSEIKNSKERSILLKKLFIDFPELIPYCEKAVQIMEDFTYDCFYYEDLETYIDFLIWFREELPDVYQERFGVYDFDIICYLILKDRKENVSQFLSYFKKYPHLEPHYLVNVMEILKVTNCSFLYTDLVKNNFENIFKVIEPKKRERFIDNVVFSNIVPYLKKDYSEVYIANICSYINDLKWPQDVKTTIETKYASQEYVYSRFYSIYAKPLDLKALGIQTRSDRSIRNAAISLNFMRYLHEKKNKDWITAKYYSDTVYDHFRATILEKVEFENMKMSDMKMNMKIEKDFAQGKHKGKLINIFTHFSALYYFAEYLDWAELFAARETDKLRKWCKLKYEEIYRLFEKDYIAMRIFKTFPY